MRCIRRCVLPQGQGRRQGRKGRGFGSAAGHALLGDGGEHKLAGLAVGQGSAGFGVDDLGEEAVLRYMEAVMLGAFHGYAGAGDLAEAVDVEAFDVQALFDIAAHGIRPGLCAEDAALSFICSRGMCISSMVSAIWRA